MNSFLVYLFSGLQSVSLLMSPIYNFLVMSGFEPKVLPQQAVATN